MMIHSIEHEFVYIDPNQQYIDGAVEGDGSTPNTPLWNFPKTLTGNKIYLVRRSVNGYYASVSIGSTGDNTVVSLIIWGMPVVGDSHYDMVPDEVKTLWTESGDSSKAYVRFERNTIKDTLNCPYAKNLDLRGFEFITHGDVKSYYSIKVSTSSDICNTYIEKVHFYGDDCDFINGALSVDSYFGTRYLRIDNENWGYQTMIKNCIIDAYYSEHALMIGRTQYVYIEGCTINACQHNDNGSGVIHWCEGESYHAPFVTIKNCNVYAYTNPYTSEYYLQYIFTGTTAVLNVNGLTYQMADTPHYTPYQNRIYLSPLISVTLTSPGSVIENITCDFGLTTAGGYRSLIYLNYYPQTDYDSGASTVYGQYTIVKDITINMARTPQYSDGSNYGGGNIWNTDGNNRGLITLMSDSYSRGASSDYLVQDLHLSAPRGVVLRANNALLDLKSCDFEGSLDLNRCTGKIGAISTWFPGYAVYDRGGNILYIKSITCNRSNASYEYNGQNALVPSYSSNILCGSTNGIFMPSVASNTNNRVKRCSYICTNDQIPGNYTARNSYSECRTWSVNRVGSVGGCSLRLTNESGYDDNTYPLNIAGEPFKGISISAAAGNRKAIVHVAMYGYNDFTQVAEKFRIKITRPDGSYEMSTVSGTWSVDDASEWENVEGQTQYKCEIPFTLAEDCQVQFEYQFAWAMKGGVLYLDPYPDIV